MKTIAFILLTWPLLAQTTTLVMIGGGPRPPSALKAFVDAANGPIVVLPWGTDYPQESFANTKRELEAQGAIAVTCACTQALSTAQLQAMQTARGIYFPGGDQNEIMRRLRTYNLVELIQRKFREGAAVAGTSAGTAIQTDPMLTGSGTQVASGLGLFRGFIVDQHFLVRRREARLLGVLERFPERHGLGIDEGMAVVIHNASLLVHGPTEVVVYRRLNGEIQESLLKNGESTDL